MATRIGYIGVRRGHISVGMSDNEAARFDTGETILVGALRITGKPVNYGPDEDYQEVARLRHMMAERERLLEGLLREVLTHIEGEWEYKDEAGLAFVARIKEALGAGNGASGSDGGLIADAGRTDAVRVNRSADKTVFLGSYGPKVNIDESGRVK